MADREARQTADVDEVLSFAERYEPATTRLLGEVLRWGLGRTNRATVVEGPGGVEGVVVVTRRCRDRWDATVALAAPDAAPLLARIVDDSKAWTLRGMGEHVAPVIPHLRRLVSADNAPFHGMAVPVDQLAGSDPRIREATAADLDALVQLYAVFEQQHMPTRPRLRRFLREALAMVPVLVAEVDGDIVGAVRCDWSSRTYDFWWAQTVKPEHRGQGIGDNLLFAAMAHSGARGRSTCGVIGPSNPTNVLRGHSWKPFSHLQDQHLENDWMTVRLGPPHHSLLHRAARWGLETIEGRTRSR